MGTNAAGTLDAWLRAGGIVVASSERAARTAVESVQHARRAQGLHAWPALAVYSWTAFVRWAAEGAGSEERLLLNPVQEQALWAGVIEASGHAAGWLPQTRNRMAKSSMEAYALLCGYAPTLLSRTTRGGWQGDAAVFSDWLAQFDQRCREKDVVSAGSLPAALPAALAADLRSRAPLLLTGFDRLTPVQEAVFSAWGKWQHTDSGTPAHDVAFYGAPDDDSELAACVEWCRRQLQRDPDARLLLLAQDVARRRGALERAFLRDTDARIEFSLGVPLRDTALARAARLLLSWLDAPLAEQEIDWLAGSGYGSARAEDAAALQAQMRALRQRGRQRGRWSWESLAGRTSTVVHRAAWSAGLSTAQQTLRKAGTLPLSPRAWAELVPRLLREAGWPGPHPLVSAEFQAHRRWQQTVELCGSLGFDGRTCSWKQFLADLDRALADTLFAAESQNPGVLIAGPAESAGLHADGLWFLGAAEDNWPARGAMHPFLPRDLQRRLRMPHASPQHDWDLAEAVTRRLLASAPQVRFSFAAQVRGIEAGASRLVAKLVGAPLRLPDEAQPDRHQAPLTETFVDAGEIPHRGAARITGTTLEIAGGSNILTAQSQCPFKAFAGARLGARTWDTAEAGLSPAQRGQLLHTVLHRIWGDAEGSIHTLAELKALPDLEEFVSVHVRRAFEANAAAEVREVVPVRYLDLEMQRLTRLIAEWLRYERGRARFEVAATEREASVRIGALSLKLRLDRVDRLSDGSLLVIDYKTGMINQRAWDLPRPNDVQLPLYANFALGGEQIGGLVFAKVRPDKQGFEGKVRNPAATWAEATAAKSSTLDELSAQQLDAWRLTIEDLARDFIGGRTDVDPREYPKTCQYCGLHVLCRVRERSDEEDTSASDVEGNDD